MVPEKVTYTDTKLGIFTMLFLLKGTSQIEAIFQKLAKFVGGGVVSQKNVFLFVESCV